MDASGPRYRDREESRFYQARGLSPEQTWQALGDELARVLDDAQRAFWRTALRIDPERVRWWHGAIFARPFPHDGGRFRRERAFFGLLLPDDKMRQLEGVAPETIHRELASVCATFNRSTESFVALSAALWSFGLPNVRFIGTEEMVAHDDALVPALISAPGEVEPFAQLLAQRIEGAGSDPA